MVYIHFTKAGTGAGIICNGKLIRGGSNFAGELGFMPVSSETHLNYVLDSDPDDDTYIDTIARVIAAVNCVINPDFVVVGGEFFRFELTEKVKKRCIRYIASNVMPDIFSSEDSRHDYLTGITHLTVELMHSGVKLIDNTGNSGGQKRKSD